MRLVGNDGRHYEPLLDNIWQLGYFDGRRYERLWKASARGGWPASVYETLRGERTLKRSAAIRARQNTESCATT